jgi:uncharacterized membrane protein
MNFIFSKKSFDVRSFLLSRNNIFSFFILLISLALLWMPPLYESPYSRDEQRYTGKILSTDNSLVKQFGIVKTGSQQLRVLLTDGPFTGQEINADNLLIGKMESDKMFRPGDQVLVILSVHDNKITAATAYDHYRLGMELILILIFAGILIIVTGWTGLKTCLSIFFAIIVIWKILLPGILAGFDPILSAFLVVMAIAGVTLFSVAGLTKTALVAWLGAFLGILLTAVLALWMFPPFRLHGAIQPYSETLLYSGFADLNLARLFIAAIFLGASGAVIDLAIDVSAAMSEVARKRPDLSFIELTKSGLYVGRPMAATMVTTLLMAYVSEYMALIMVLLSKGIPLLQVVNLNYISAVILKTIVGSFGMITVAPFTALVGGFMNAKRRNDEVSAYKN